MYLSGKSAKIKNFKIPFLLSLGGIIEGVFFFMKRRSIIDGKLNCARCKNDFELSFFHKNKQQRIGYDAYCKNCNALRRYKIKSVHISIENLDGEIWKDIVGYEGFYQVSNLGRIKTLDRINKLPNKVEYISIRESLMKIKTTKNGYSTIKLYNNSTGKSKEYFVHKLVLIMFSPNPENKLEGNHKNGIKSDNTLENLEWCTRAENNRHAIETGLLVARKGSEVYNAKLNEEKIALIRRFYRRFPKTKQRDFSKRIEICHKQLNSILKNRTWKHVKI